MSGRVSITFECPQCGGTKIKLPDDYTDDSAAVCENPECDAEFGRWGDIKEKALAKAAKAAKDEIRKAIRKGFKRR